MNTPVPFQISALSPEPFAPLFALPDAELRARRIRRQVVEESPGTPCRVSLTDAKVGETVLLLPFTHQEADSPFHAGGAIFVREKAAQARPAVNEVPEAVRRRLLSVRAFDAEGMMVRADVIAGADLESGVARFFGEPNVRYLHLHIARQGCYHCRVDRA